ncbi:MAG: exonuclease subunit SbcD, partial [Chloroflexi bacterium]|nr:exonuclease subunit SbcD [Chloroflexota bacterium]
MKIVHFADLHLGVESYGKTDPVTGLSSRLNDFLKVFDELVIYSIENKIDVVVFCGDAYRSRDPSQTQQREFARRINQLSANNIKVFLLVGNHDMPNAFGRATSIEIFNTLDIKNVYVANSPGTHRIETGKGLLQIVALPWAKRSSLLSREETKDFTIKQLNDKLQQILSNIIASETANLNPDIPAILAGHTFVSTAKLGTEKAMTLGNEYSLLHSEVVRPEFDYIALGHVHKHQ